MNTTHRPARIAAVLLIALVSWAIAAPLAVAAATSGAHTPKAGTPQRELVPLASHGAPVPQALRLEGHDRRRVDAGLQGAAGRVRLRPRDGGRDSRAPRRAGQGHARAAPRAARSRRRAIRASATSHRFTASGRRRACRTTRISPTSTARRSCRTSGRSSRRTWIALWTSPEATRTSSSASSTPASRTCPTSPARSTASGRSTGRRRLSEVDSNDDYGHGTAVGSLIAANIDDGIGMAGFGGDTHVIGIHAGDDGIFTDTQVAVALTKLVSLGVRIVNMSLGGRTPSEPILVDAIHDCGGAGRPAHRFRRQRRQVRRLAGGGPPAVGRRSQLRHRRRRNRCHGPPRVLLGLRQAPLARRAGDLRRHQRRHARRASAREPVRQRVHDAGTRTARTTDTSRARPSRHRRSRASRR